MTTDKTTKLSAIDLALAAAKARKAAKDASTSSEPTTPKAKPTKAEKVAATPKVKKSPATDDEAKAARKAQREETKAQKLAALEAERTARRTAREAAKAEKAVAKKTADADKKPAHMKKVEKAASKLPKLNDQATLMFNDIISNLDAASIASMALHLQHHNRVAATQRAREVTLEAGDSVRIIGGDPRYIGMNGTVDRAQRIRCYVEVPGFKRPIYLFTSDVERTEANQDVSIAS